MTKALPQAWTDVSSSPISEEAVRKLHQTALHQTAKNTKFYLNQYEAAQTTEIKASHAFLLYVLAGNCELTLAGNAISVDTAQFIALDEGVFTCTAGPKGVRFIKVFERN